MDILNLDAAKHEALCRPATKASDTFRFTTLAPASKPRQSFAQKIVAQTRTRYSRLPAVQTPVPARPVASPRVEAETPAPVLKLETPAPAVPKEFRTTQDRVLHYLNVAEYLS